MIELIIKIENDKMIIAYKDDRSNFTDSSNINDANLIIFADILKYINNRHEANSKHLFDEFTAKSWIEKNIEKTKEILLSKK